MKISVVAIAILTVLILIVSRIIFGDIPDRVEAMKIPKYPNATAWKITDVSNWPDFSPQAEICLKTSDNETLVFSYYKDELTKHGWNVSDVEKNIIAPHENRIKINKNNRYGIVSKWPYDCNYVIWIRSSGTY